MASEENLVTLLHLMKLNLSIDDSLPFEAGFMSWETLWVWLLTIDVCWDSWLTPFLSGCTNSPWFCEDWKLFTPPWLRYGCCWPTENALWLGGNLPPDITYHTFKTYNMGRCWVESSWVVSIAFEKRECTQFFENFVNLTPACSHEMQMFEYAQWTCS